MQKFSTCLLPPTWTASLVVTVLHQSDILTDKPAWTHQNHTKAAASRTAHSWWAVFCGLGLACGDMGVLFQDHRVGSHVSSGTHTTASEGKDSR